MQQRQQQINKQTNNEKQSIPFYFFAVTDFYYEDIFFLGLCIVFFIYFHIYKLFCCVFNQHIDVDLKLTTPKICEILFSKHFFFANEKQN